MEWSCSRVMVDLSEMSSSKARVIRDGHELLIDTSSVVKGDVILLRSGDVVPADCMLLETTDLQTNEAALTGEPHEITKSLKPLYSSAFPTNMLYASTEVVNGTGKGLVLRTGMRTEIGQISKQLGSHEMEVTMIQITLNKIGNMLTLVIGVLVLFVVGVSYHFRVNDPADPCQGNDDECFFQKSAMRGLFAAVGAVPESLQPACMTLLMIGCIQMRDVNAAVRRLASVDTLGACSFICSDKTGTLTEGKMTCVCLYPRVRMPEASTGEQGDVGLDAQRRYGFYPTRGFDPIGGIFDQKLLTAEVKARLDSEPNPAIACGGDLQNFADFGDVSADALLVRTCMTAVCLNCHSTKLVRAEDGTYSIEGNMSEGALVVACSKAQLEASSVQAMYPREVALEIPFSSSRKMMASVHSLKTKPGQFVNLHFEGNYTHVAIIKGAPDVLRSHISCSMMRSHAGALSPNEPGSFDSSDGEWFEASNAEMASKALRVLCVTLRPLTADDITALEGCANGDDRLKYLLSQNVMLLSLFGLIDPPRASAKLAVQECKQAGIRVAMITGDQEATAAAVAKDLGILNGDEDRSGRVALCETLREKTDVGAIDDMCNRVTVWARAKPEDKVKIVRSLRRQSHIVAMTGDGVNDAGALKESDVGLAMGIAGTDVTKDTADMVLMDDRFATIINAIVMGRTIFENIQKMTTYLLCVNIFDVVYFLLAMLLGLTVPLEDSQLFKANFVTHMFYPWCMIFEGPSRHSMQLPPRDRQKPLVPRLVRTILIPLVFVAYIFCLLGAQLAGSLAYAGTALREEQMGTTSISDFYDDDTGFTCLFANTLIPVPQGDGLPYILQYKQDIAPLHCRVRKLHRGQLKYFEEWGRCCKKDPEDSIQTGMFNEWLGFWGDQFHLNNSFLAPSFHGDVKTFESEHWKDHRGWLVKCNDITIKSADGELVSGDSDRLCWQTCDGQPCWERDLIGPRQGAGSLTKLLEKREEDDATLTEDEPANKPVLYKKYNSGAWAVRQMRSVVVLTLVMMEMSLLFAFSKHEFSLPRLSENGSFKIAWVPMLLVVLSFVYMPVSVFDQQFARLDLFGLLTAIGFAALFYAMTEAAKAMHRSYFDEELPDRVRLAGLVSEGKLRAFAGHKDLTTKMRDLEPFARTGEARRQSYNTFEAQYP
eukprot:TRINITY_DN2184_c1_g4_i1.p1 TRINITY_DN2184_c1_g4~~TRINITY_DN2184_c1_g4_i1.p1  ORF type:complete len:1362 (-),score=247.19 TRINITY_DN2184_c1_g4_i1:78-3569(-)